jgi:hypothetical protein
MSNSVEIAARLNLLPESTLSIVVRGRLSRLPSFVLPPVGREDPSKLLIDSFRHPEGGIPHLKTVSAAIIADWQSRPIEEHIKNPHPLGEALYLASSIGAMEAVPPISDVANNDQMIRPVLSSGEDLQGFALRALAGLLVGASKETQVAHRISFENALQRLQHVPIGLMTLAGFWPEEQADFIQEVRTHYNSSFERLISLVDVIVPAFRASSAASGLIQRTSSELK